MGQQGALYAGTRTVFHAALRKCCDVGYGCKGEKPDCGNTILTQDEYRGWKNYIDDKDKKSNGNNKVGYYYWAVCTKCREWTKSGSKQITMRDGFQYPFKSRKKGSKDKVALVTEQKPEPPATGSSAQPAPTPGMWRLEIPAKVNDKPS